MIIIQRCRQKYWAVSSRLRGSIWGKAGNETPESFQIQVNILTTTVPFYETLIVWYILSGNQNERIITHLEIVSYNEKPNEIRMKETCKKP